MSGCPEATSRYRGLLREIGERRVLGSTEVALRILRGVGELLRHCRQDAPRELPEAVRAAVTARPTSQAVKNLLQLFLGKFKVVAESSGLTEALEAIDSLVRDVETYAVSSRERAAELASKRLEDGDTVMTHSYSTTVLRLLEKAVERGIKLKVYVTESRPGGEGRLTASHLGKRGVKTILVVDSASRYVMKDVDKVFVGAEAISANGAVVNKVGTSTVALAAKEARVRVYVVSATYKFSGETLLGELVTIEELESWELVIPESRAEDLLPYLGRNVHVRSPLYDVTPPEYIDAIITERGVVAPQAAVYLARQFLDSAGARKSLEETVEEVISLWR